MSSRKDLNTSTSDRFEFTVGGLDYDLIIPTMEEIEPISELNTERQIEETKNTPESVERIAKIDKQLEKTLYSFIHPAGHETPIVETLKKQSLRVVRAFNKTINEQLSAE